MYHIPIKISPLNVLVNSFFTEFKVNILLFTNKQWNSEDLKGSSFYQWKVKKYYDLLYLIILLYTDIQKNIKLNLGWQYYVTKYNLVEFKKCLACDNISLDQALNIFGINEIFPNTGIELMEEEFNLEVGTSETSNISSTKIKDLILTPYSCTNYIQN